MATFGALASTQSSGFGDLVSACTVEAEERCLLVNRRRLRHFREPNPARDMQIFMKSFQLTESKDCMSSKEYGLRHCLADTYCVRKTRLG